VFRWEEGRVEGCAEVKDGSLFPQAEAQRHAREAKVCIVLEVHHVWGGSCENVGLRCRPVSGEANPVNWLIETLPSVGDEDLERDGNAAEVGCLLGAIGDKVEPVDAGNAGVEANAERPDLWELQKAPGGYAVECRGVDYE
jgi:hypothetical protein